MQVFSEERRCGGRNSDVKLGGQLSVNCCKTATLQLKRQKTIFLKSTDITLKISENLAYSEGKRKKK